MSALEHSLAEERVAEPQPSLMLGDAILKWYDVAPPEEPVPLAIRALARRSLRDATKDGTLGIEDGLGFIVLQRCEGDVYVLHVSTWLDESRRWETVWSKCAEDVFFRPSPEASDTVSEHAAGAHEREAWMRYLLSARDETARRDYLRDCYSGLV
jgi:hypothetical protein